MPDELNELYLERFEYLVWMIIIMLALPTYFAPQQRVKWIYALNSASFLLMWENEVLLKLGQDQISNKCNIELLFW